MTEHVFDELPAYVLEVMDEGERDVVRRHLDDCDLCRLELSSLTETLTALPVGLVPLNPPASLKTRIMEGARAENYEPARSVSQPARRTTPTIGGQLPGRSRLLSLSFVAGLAVVLFAAGISVGSLFRVGPSAAQRYNALVSAAVSKGDRVGALRAAAGFGTVNMTLVEAASGATSLIEGPSASPPSGKIYQLWFIRGGKNPISLGVFHPDGGTAARIPLRISGRGYQVGAMTVEPGPIGSPQPTTKPFAEASIS